MNFRHLADALDHWKGAVIRILCRQLNDIHVVPMFTDKDVTATWTKDSIGLYAQLIGVPDDHILQRGVRFTTRSRSEYFVNLETDSNVDLFVDPDTGIEPATGGNAAHIRHEELSQLLPNGSQRVVLVYQHSSREEKWTQACLQRVVLLEGCHACAYWAGAVSMLFVSRVAGRLDTIQQVLGRTLAPRDDRLIRIVPARPSCR